MKRLLCCMFILLSSLGALQAIMHKDAKIYVAGHTGLVGSAVVKLLRAEGFSQIVTRSSAELDLRDQHAVENFFKVESPEYVFLAAAKVGGIQANIDRPASFLYDNLIISANIIDASYRYKVKKLLYLGSSCIYPRMCEQPIKADYLLTGPLESTNEPYALAKIAGIKLCQTYNRQYGTNFIACMPTNLYGPGDNFDLRTSHVLPALIAKLYHAAQNDLPVVMLWGTGRPYREFLYVDDLADALLFLMNYYDGQEPINVGVGNDITIANLAHMVKEIVGYHGEIVFDPHMPDGTPRKLLDVSVLTALGWSAQTSLQEGIENTLQWCVENKIFENKK